MRKAEVIDEKIGRDGRSDGVCDQFRNCTQSSAENTKKPAPVTKLQELPQGKAACFAPAVQAISGQRHEYAERGCDGSPETDRETGLVELFGVCHKRNHG